MILVPRDTPGSTIKRGMEVFGYDDREKGGHAELEFADVRAAGDLPVDVNMFGGGSCSRVRRRFANHQGEDGTASRCGSHLPLSPEFGPSSVAQICGRATSR